MAKHFKILALLLLTKFSLYGQVGFSSKVFHKHLQTCHFVGTTEEDYIIVLNGDSTINVTKYTSDYHDQYNTVVKQSYFGTYSRFGDTIKVIFTGHSSISRSKIKPTNTFYPAKKEHTLYNTDRIFIYPPTTYITSDDKIISIDSLFPVLPNSTKTNIILLESEFMNWDKNSIYKSEVFGLSR
jgi:hypothetical protein